MSESILTKFIRSDGRLNSAAIRHIKELDLNALIDETNFIQCQDVTVTFRLQTLRQEFTDQPVCETCGSPITKLNERHQVKRWCDNLCYRRSEDFIKNLAKRDYSKSNSKRKQTMLAKYGVEFNSQREDMKPLLGQHCKDIQWKESARIKGIEQFDHIDRERYSPEVIHSMNLSKSCVEISDEIGCSQSYVIHTLNKNGFDVIRHFHSQQEKQLCEWLSDNGIDYIAADRTVLRGREIDIYIPSHNLAIEVNGLYWHSELRGKDRNYHLSKSLACKEQGIQLLHFWDFEIRERFSIVQSMLRSHLGESTRIHGRKCDVVAVSKDEEKSFIDSNHLYGYTPSTSCIGLVFQGDLIQVMSFKKPRFNKNADWEILRLCTKTNHTAVGGSSKLFSRRPQGSVVSYADRRFSEGNVYEQLGMHALSVNKPAYHYTKDHQCLQSRVKYQKHKLPNILENFDPLLSEWQNMMDHGYDRVWDCGTITFST